MEKKRDMIDVAVVVDLHSGTQYRVQVEAGTSTIEVWSSSGTQFHKTGVVFHDKWSAIMFVVDEVLSDDGCMTVTFFGN